MPVYGPPMAMEPGGTRVRGSGRRGAASSPGNPVRYGKPGENPMNATRYSADACRLANSSGEIPAPRASSERSPPS